MLNARGLHAAATGCALILACLLSAPPLTAQPADSQPRPLLSRIEIATVGTTDTERFAANYSRWLDYDIVHRGEVAERLAASWGAPASAGRSSVLMRPRSSAEAYIRAVEVDSDSEHEPLSTTGWNVIELLVEDPDAVYERLQGSPFRHIGGPANLSGGTSSIRAVQFTGPDAETLYFTADTASLEKARLPRAQSAIDRPFIMVLGTHHPHDAYEFYQRTFALGGYPPRPVTVGVINRMQGLDPDHRILLGFATAAEPGNAIEIDGYPATTRRRTTATGQLPPGVAITSFAVRDIDIFALEFIEPPSSLYGERRAATFIGPAGELTELIEITEAE